MDFQLICIAWIIIYKGTIILTALYQAIDSRDHGVDMFYWYHYLNIHAKLQLCLNIIILIDYNKIGQNYNAFFKEILIKIIIKRHNVCHTAFYLCLKRLYKSDSQI